jgi:hypothetical protein
MSFRNYIQNVRLNQLFRKLNAPNPELLAKEVRYFTTEKAEKRDQILLDYLGENGINQIVNIIYEFLFAPPRLPVNAKVLDVGAGAQAFSRLDYMIEFVNYFRRLVFMPWMQLQPCSWH